MPAIIRETVPGATGGEEGGREVRVLGRESAEPTWKVMLPGDQLGGGEEGDEEASASTVSRSATAIMEGEGSMPMVRVK